MSVGASSSSTFAASRSCCCRAVGKRRRGLIDERVKRPVIGNSALLPLTELVSESSFGNLRNIFLPRLFDSQ